MLYIYFGSDSDKVHSEAYAAITSLRHRKPDATFYKVESEQVAEHFIDELIESQGLFEQKYIIQLNQTFENKNSKDVVIDRLKQIAESNNIFIITEHKLTPAVQKKLKEHAHKVHEFNVVGEGGQFGIAGAQSGTFNIFALADALGEKDKKRLWVLLQKSAHSRVSAEEIHGTLMWQIRMMLIAKQSKTAEECGVKPFVFNKAKRHAENYSLDELRELSQKFVAMYHNVRSGGAEVGVSLERLALELR